MDSAFWIIVGECPGVYILLRITVAEIRLCRQDDGNTSVFKTAQQIVEQVEMFV